jgi:IclR family pca regulon transcriptional regulator
MPKNAVLEKRPDYVTSLDRGLRVLQTFSRDHAQLTLSEVAALTKLSPATARRSLHTLEHLGYVGRSGRRFLLRPKVLSISSGYLSAINAEMVLQPFLQDLVNEVGGSSSVTILDDLQIVYLAHASANRAIRLTAGVAARYPAYATSMGRTLLAFQPEWVIEAYFSRAVLRKLTEHTETNATTLRRILKETREKGYTSIQDELDYGIVSVALPIFGADGTIVAAANCADVTTRLSKKDIVTKRLPALRQAVRRIEGMLTQYPELANSVASQNAAPRDIAAHAREPVVMTPPPSRSALAARVSRTPPPRRRS